MPTKKLSLDFIYIDAGGGHRSAVLALSEVIASRYPSWQINPINLFQDVLRPIDPIHRLTRIRRSEDIYNSILKSGRTYGFTTMLRVMHKMIRWHAPAIENMLRHYWQKKPQPDLVVSLTPHFNGAMFRSLQAAYPHVPFVTVMTDLADTPPHFWQETQDQFIICGSDKAFAQAQTMGYDAGKIFKVSGMILKPNFYEDYSGLDRLREREKLGLDPSAPTALIMFGGHGAGTAEKIVKRLRRLRPHVQSIVMCGHNEKLRKKLLKDFLDDVIVRLRPEPALFQLPAIDNVADEVKVFGFRMFEKIKQPLSLASMRAEMNIRNPYGAKTQDFAGAITRRRCRRP